MTVSLAAKMFIEQRYLSVKWFESRTVVLYIDDIEMPMAYILISQLTPYNYDKESSPSIYSL